MGRYSGIRPNRVSLLGVQVPEAGSVGVAESNAAGRWVETLGGADEQFCGAYGFGEDGFGMGRQC